MTQSIVVNKYSYTQQVMVVDGQLTYVMGDLISPLAVTIRFFGAFHTAF